MGRFTEHQYVSYSCPLFDTTNPDDASAHVRNVPEGTAWAKKEEGRTKAHGIIIVEDDHAVGVQQWLENQSRRFGWVFDWSDSYTVAQAGLEMRLAADR